MKVLAFGTSNSRNSINQKLARYSAAQIDDAIDNVNVTLLDIHDLEMPIFSEEREKESGIPAFAHDFYQAIGEADAIVISFAEYNGSYTSAYKNLFDWASRIDMKVYQDKPMIMLTTSPGLAVLKACLLRQKVQRRSLQLMSKAHCHCQTFLITLMRRQALSLMGRLIKN